jgi:uncharacterized RDD family membrane protein YckC
MTDASTQNPFAPPRAHVEDQFAAPQQMVTATRLSRFLAILVDCAPALAIGVVGVILALSMMPGLLTGKVDPFAGGLMVFGLFWLIVVVGMIAWIVWQIVLLYKYGQTVGKKVMGIRVVRMDGSRVTFARFFFLRGLATGIIGAVIGAVIDAILHVKWGSNVFSLVDALVIFGAASRCIHDYIADTQVVTAASSEHATLEGSLRH